MRHFSIGQRTYAISVATINFIVVLIFVEELLRTWGWSNLSKFNYSDVCSVIIASLLGGRASGMVKVKLSSEDGVLLKFSEDSENTPLWKER